MLGLQTSNLQEQEQLFNSEIKLGLRQILQQELAFYRSAFGVIAKASAFFAGFAFDGLLMTPYIGSNSLRPAYMTSADIQRFQFTLNTSGVLTILISVCTMLHCKFLTLFATRYALRGGGDAVEYAVVNLRREYRGCIYALTFNVEVFVFMMSQLCMTKMPRLIGLIISALCLVTGICVVFLAYRAISLFSLPSEGFGRSRNLGAFASAVDDRNRGYSTHSGGVSSGGSDRFENVDEVASRASTATAPREMSGVSASSAALNRVNAARGWSADSSSSNSSTSSGDNEKKKKSPSFSKEAQVNQANPMLEKDLTSPLLDELEDEDGFPPPLPSSSGSTTSKLFRRFRAGRQESGNDEASITKTQVNSLQ